MKEKIPVTKEVLRWARLTMGLSVDEVARKMGKDINTIVGWESGKVTPTYVQLEKLAYQIYKRPLAIFFFPHPPEEETLKQSFRTLPEQEIETLSPRVHYLLRQARVMKINLSELNSGVNPAEKNIIHDLSFNPDIPATEIATKVRKYLNVDLNHQFSWSDVDSALKEWRNRIEVHGVFIFKEAFKDDFLSGFCVYDKIFPLIYINNSKPKTRQIFSIFHELCHLLLKTGGIDTRNDRYINYLKGDDKKIEILCNRFAGEFLVPDIDFDSRISDIDINDTSIENLAFKYKVSREVILRKLFDRNIVDQEYYNEKSNQWTNEIKPKQKSGRGDYYATKKAYLGENYIELAFSNYYKNQISVDQLADYLGVKTKNISGIEHLLLNKGEMNGIHI
ncbi:XRE family transcriptional regulator [Candidatus Magnetomorum sp. HK-1]|nr:XRE family transcriptional regulator [Candidatus Magnetomorum sp. HK-1]